KRRNGPRWRLVGNAVSVPVSTWLGHRLLDPVAYDGKSDPPVLRGAPWPRAAWGSKGKAYRAHMSSWPVRLEYQHLLEFLHYPTTPLSERAAAGFLKRVRASTTLRFPKGFKTDIAKHLRRIRALAL